MRETTQLKQAQIELGQRKMKDYLEVAGRGLEQGPAKILPGIRGSSDHVLTFLPIWQEDVAQVYVGRPGCMCGCRGHYSFNSKEDAIADKDPEGVVNPAQVRKILGLLSQNSNKGIEFSSSKLWGGQDIYSLEHGGKSYVVYTKKGRQKTDQELQTYASVLNKARAGMGVKR